jgi:hypothetical protein
MLISQSPMLSNIHPAKAADAFLALLFATGVCTAPPAQADTWACEVLLCLSNPAGPTAVTQCVPSISRLWRHLALGHAFPTCDMGSGAKGNSASNEWASGENCPQGYQYFGGADNKELLCHMSGAVTVMVNGSPASKVWWSSDQEPLVESNLPAPAPDKSIVTMEVRVVACADASTRPEYRGRVAAPAPAAVPDGYVVYAGAAIAAVAHGGYADRALYDGDVLVGYGYAKETRYVTKDGRGGVQGATAWRAIQFGDCSLGDPDGFVPPQSSQSNGGPI